MSIFLCAGSFVYLNSLISLKSKGTAYSFECRKKDKVLQVCLPFLKQKIIPFLGESTFLHSAYSIYICSDNFLEEYLQYLREIVENTYYFAFSAKSRVPTNFCKMAGWKYFRRKAGFFLSKSSPTVQRSAALTPYCKRKDPKRSKVLNSIIRDFLLTNAIVCI